MDWSDVLMALGSLLVVLVGAFRTTEWYKKAKADRLKRILDVLFTAVVARYPKVKLLKNESPNGKLNDAQRRKIMNETLEETHERLMGLGLSAEREGLTRDDLVAEVERMIAAMKHGGKVK